MSDIWLYHPAEPQGRIVDTAIVDALMLDGWVKTPRDLPPGLWFGNDGTSPSSRIGLGPVSESTPMAAAPVAAPEAEIAVTEEMPSDSEDPRWKDMTRLELIAFAKNTYNEAIPQSFRRAEIIAKLKTFEEL